MGVMQVLLQHGIHIRKPPHPPLDHYVRVSVGTPEGRGRLGRALRDTLATLAARGQVAN
jgi:histidinol-phosphate/aromatic aminotransferase/cobyric acid decarboxylase-like protein